MQCLNLIQDCVVFVANITFDGCPTHFSMAKSLKDVPLI
jgi:hypothetical protein